MIPIEGDKATGDEQIATFLDVTLQQLRVFLVGRIIPEISRRPDDGIHCLQIVQCQLGLPFLRCDPGRHQVAFFQNRQVSIERRQSVRSWARIVVGNDQDTLDLLRS